MPSTCPKCHRILEEDEICCAQVRYTWRCRKCFKLATGTALPYGNCFMCGGELEPLPDRDLGDGMRFHAIHDAVQFELDFFYFYRLALMRATCPEECLVAECLSEAALDHLHELEEKYRAHLEDEIVQIASDQEKLLSDWPCKGIALKCPKIPDLYGAALAMERRAHDHFLELEGDSAGGVEKELCKELAADMDEHIAMLETELEQLEPQSSS